jgi:hypothetical protein
MNDIPKFILYGEDDPLVEESIQPCLDLRNWGNLTDEEKNIALRELRNSGWLESHTSNILSTIKYLNRKFLRQCPGKQLHAIKPEYYGRPGNDFKEREAAVIDFEHIFLHEQSDAMVLHMLSMFAQSYIDHNWYQHAEQAQDVQEREEYITSAFAKFARLANCLNHIFEQFAVNQIVTRNGFVPRQDEKIVDNIYVPTLKVLADPKWQSVSADLVKVFDDFRDQNYSECITKAHSVVQRFLQVLVGEEGKSGRGEVGKLFSQAKREGYISVNQFTTDIISAIQKFIPSERATNSTAKPALKDATSSDALLMMNVVMVFLQHCLQNIK